MNVGCVSCCPSWLFCQWSWRKTAVLGVVLAALAVGICDLQGVNSIGTLCGIGGACFVTPLLFKKMREKTVTLPVEEGKAYDLNQQKDLIIEAIRSEKTLTWEGKPFLRPGEISILPNVRIGRMREMQNQIVIRLRLWKGDDRWPRKEQVDGFQTSDQCIYVLTYQGVQVQNEPNPSPDIWMDRYMKIAAQCGHPVLITGITSSDVAKKNESIGDVETSTYQWEYATRFDAGIILIRYLKHLTATTNAGEPSGITVDQVRRYVEKQLGCTYADELTYPTMQFPVRLSTLLQ